MSTTAIEVRGLRKAYGPKVVLDGVGLTVHTGTVTALLGPNGAGKTTTEHILSTLVRPDGGEAFVNGCDVTTDPDGVRAAIGITPVPSSTEEVSSARPVSVSDALYMNSSSTGRKPCR